MGLWGKLIGRLDRDEFVEEMLRRVRAVRGDCTYDEQRFAIRAGEGVHFLGNHWNEYQRLPSRRDRHELLRRFSLMLSEAEVAPPKSFDEARPLLRPMVREQMFYAMMKLHHRAQSLPGDAGLPNLSLGAHLTVTAAIDSPTSMREVSLETLGNWKVTLDEAIEEAKKNLGRVSHAQWPETRPGLLQAPFGDYYDAGRAALPHVIRQLKVRGAPVALVLQRGVMAVTGSDDEKGLCELAAVGEESAELPRAMSAFLVRLDGSQWVPHALPQDHPAFERMELLRVQWTMNNYEEQRDVLQKIVGDDTYVCKYLALRNPAGELRSIATLTLDVPALLPLSDEVAIMRVGDGDSGLIAQVPWRTACEACGLADEPDLYPPRVRTDGNVSAERLAQLTS